MSCYLGVSISAIIPSTTITPQGMESCFVNVRRLDGISKPQSPPQLSLCWRRADAALVNHEAALLLSVCHSEVLDPVSILLYSQKTSVAASSLTWNRRLNTKSSPA